MTDYGHRGRYGGDDGDAASTAPRRAPGKQTLVQRRYAGVPASGRRGGMIQRDACLDPEAVIADLQRIAREAAKASQPDALRELSRQLEVLGPVINGCSTPTVRGPLERERRKAQDAIVAAYQGAAVGHADQTLQAWSKGSDDDKEKQRDTYHKESGSMPEDADWCGMFANAQFRAAGMSGALDMAFNSTFHVREFFSYGAGSANSPSHIQPHGKGAPMELRLYHVQRGALRSWLEGAAIGHDVRPGDIVTLDWIGSKQGADHITIVRSYAPDTGTLITIDGNAYGAKQPGPGTPDFGKLDPNKDMNALANATDSDVGTSQYQAGAGGQRKTRDGDGPAFNRDAMLAGNGNDVVKAMTMVGRGRPSMVDFETDHVYPDFTGSKAEAKAAPGGPLQRRESGASVDGDPEAAFAAATAGAAGEIPYRAEMQAHFGADFSTVQAFIGRDLTSLGAHAATRDETVAFASASPDKETVAHELTHVLQTRAGTVSGGGMSDPGDASEHEARDVAADFTAGHAAKIDAAPSGAIHRQDDGKTPVPPAVQPPTADGHQSGRLDWDAYYGIDMAPAGGPQANSIREIYDFYLLRQLRAQFSTEAATVAIPDDALRGRAAVTARHTAVERLGTVLRDAMLARQTAGDQPGAEAMRVRLFSANQHALVEALQVESSSRYRKPKEGDKTWCNIYAYDVVTALGGYLPRTWWTADAIAKIQHGARVVTPDEYTRLRAAQPAGDLGVVANNAIFTEQMSANALTRWMIEWGGTTFGWSRLPSAQDGQASANHGHIVIVLARNVDEDKAGHVSVVLAENAQHQHPTETRDDVYVPLQSQAGAANFETNDTDAAVGSAGRRAWWSEPAYADGAFWAYTGAPQAALAIQPPERLGTVQPRPDQHVPGAGQ